MGFNSKLMTGVLAVSGDLNAVAVGTSKPGPTLPLIDVTEGTLSVAATTLAETDTISLSVVWEVSNNGKDWSVAREWNSAGYVSVGTGTAAADSAVTNVITAPGAVYGWRYCRASVLVGGVNGAANDTYTLAYHYVRKDLL